MTANNLLRQEDIELTMDQRGCYIFDCYIFFFP